MTLQFDEKVMLESFRKALNTIESIKTELNVDMAKIDFQALALTFFTNSMRNVAESRKNKNKGGYGQEY